MSATSGPLLRPAGGGTADVHVWTVELVAAPAAEAACRDLLSRDEIARHDRLRFEADRRRFGLTRVALRLLLGRWLRRDPRELRFDAGVNGKPHLVGDPSAPSLFFNVAHSADRAMVVISEAADVGVDIEAIRPLPEAMDLADRFFSPAEAAAIRALTEPQRQHAFFQCWTRKEAYVKALGVGLSQPLDAFNVQASSDGRLAVRIGGTRAEEWSGEDLSDLPRYAAALVVRASGVRLHRHASAIEPLCVA